jgi:hypothetical protein
MDADASEAQRLELVHQGRATLAGGVAERERDPQVEDASVDPLQRASLLAGVHSRTPPGPTS